MPNDDTPKLSALPVDRLLEKIAGDRPVLPAGGSATALIGATAAAMGGFVSRIARRHAETDAAGYVIDPIMEDFDRLRRRFSDLMTEDVQAYASAMEMKRNGAIDPERVRLKMAGPPEAMAAGGMEMLVLFVGLLPHTYKPTKADFAVAVEQAKSCIDSAIHIWRASVRTSDGMARIENLCRTRDDYYGRLCPAL